MNSQVFQTPGNTSTWIDFLTRYKEAYGCFPQFPVADAGYGSYDNYMFNIKNGIELVQKYNMYEKKKIRISRKEYIIPVTRNQMKKATRSALQKECSISVQSIYQR